MADEIQEYPLMIFEVESTAGNTMAHNAVKVFGQPNEQFERPLFFFHAILESGGDTSRFDSLRFQFGQHNYRLYRLDHDEKAKLIQDILSQHRRLKRGIDLPALRGLLLHEAWAEVDPHAVMDHVEQLQFTCPYLNSYATLATGDASFAQRFVRTLAQQEGQPLRRDHVHGYKTFIGQYASRPIHIAVLAHALPEKTASLMEALRNWNEKAPLMPQIAPNFGLHREYDEFLLGTAPGLLASIAAIFGDHYEGRAYLSGLIENILKAIPNARPRLSFYNAVWLLHMAAPLPDGDAFDAARSFINDRGGISGGCLLSPPFQVPSSGDCLPEEFPWNLDIAKNPEAVPERPEFRDLVRKANPVQPAIDAHLSFAIKLLTEERNLDSLVPMAVSLLSHTGPAR